MTATSACEVEPWSSDTLLASWVVVGKLQIDVKNGTREQMMKPSLLTVEEKELGRTVLFERKNANPLFLGIF